MRQVAAFNDFAGGAQILMKYHYEPACLASPNTNFIMHGQISTSGSACKGLSKSLRHENREKPLVLAAFITNRTHAWVAYTSCRA